MLKLVVSSLFDLKLLCSGLQLLCKWSHLFFAWITRFEGARNFDNSEGSAKSNLYRNFLLVFFCKSFNKIQDKKSIAKCPQRLTIIFSNYCSSVIAVSFAEKLAKVPKTFSRSKHFFFLQFYNPFSSLFGLRCRKDLHSLQIQRE